MLRYYHSFNITIVFDDVMDFGVCLESSEVIWIKYLHCHGNICQIMAIQQQISVAAAL